MPKFAFIAMLFLAPLHGMAQSASFIVAQHGHSVGTASFNFPHATNGRESSSQVHISMQGLTYALSKTEQLTPANRLRHAQISATVNGSAVNLTATSDPAQYLLNVSANGRSTTSRLEFHPAAVLLPDFDPGALQTLLDLSNTPANARLGFWAIIPKQAGTQVGSIVQVQLATYRDEQGTLDGKPVTVHHLIATIAGAQTELFSGPDNQLLQAELPQQGFALVRDGFVLTPPARPAAPPVDEPTSTNPH
jgi:hypothetical protein